MLRSSEDGISTTPFGPQAEVITMAARMIGSRGRGARRLLSRPLRGVFEVLEGRALLATLQLPTTLSGAAGDTIRVPLLLDDSNNLETADVAISYDTTR